MHDSENIDPSSGRFTVNLPDPARRNTRAIDSLRRPVPRNQELPPRGDALELNVPPKSKPSTQRETTKDPYFDTISGFTRFAWLPTSTKEGTATSGKTHLDHYVETECCRLLHLLNCNPLNPIAPAA
jgi:hypothetical protein